MDITDHGFFERPALDVAQDLIGATLLFKDVGGITTGDDNKRNRWSTNKWLDAETTTVTPRLR